jgi:hypothetical protein
MAATEPHVIRSRFPALTGTRVPEGPARVALALALTVVGGVIALLALNHVDKLSLNGRELILTVAGSLGIAVLALPWRGIVAGFTTLAVVWLVAAFAFTVFPGDIYVATPVTQAVGASSYYGTSYLPPQYAAVGLQLLVIAAGIGGTILLRRRFTALAPGAEAMAEPSDATAALEPGEPRPVAWYRRPWIRIAVVAIAAGLIALSTYPNVYDAALTSSQSGPPDQWDTQNFLTWQWLIADTGLEPMKDFFFPYGFTWIFYDFPLGNLWQWAATVPVVAIAAWTLWRLGPEEGRATRVVICLLAMPIMGLWEGHFWRYAIPFVVAASYAAIGPGRHTRPTWGHAVVAAGVLYTGLYMLDLMIPVVVAAGLILIADVLAGRAPRNWRLLARGVAVDCLPLLVLLIVPALWLALGSFDGYFRFYTELRGTSALGASEERFSAIAHYIGARPSAAMLRVTAAALALAAAFALNAFGSPRVVTASRLLFAASGASFTVVIKHIVRDNGDIPLEVVILASLWIAVLLWTSRKPLYALAVGAYVATALFTFNRVDAVDRWWDEYATQSKRNVTRSFDLIGKSDDIERERNALFLQSRFSGWPVSQDYSTALSQAMQASPRKSFFVLGDAPILYTWLGQKPPFHIQLYDASRKSEQDATVRALRKEDPEFVFWRIDFAQDGVPQYVRDPIIFRYVVDNYVPVSITPAGDVLRKRRGKPADPKYWGSKLANFELLGFVPASSNAEDADECSGGEGCNPYAILEGDSKGKGITSFRITGRGRTFRVSVATRPEADEYPVRLDRLWFWSFVGPNPTVTATRPGWKVRRVNLRTGDALW